MGAASKTALTTTTLAVLLLMMSIFLATIPSDSLVTAQSFHPTGVRRGAYISIYGYKIGDLYTKDVQDGDVYQILGNATREEISLNFLKYWNFNAITIYQFDKVWKSTSLPAHLKSYIQRARAIGITNIEVATTKWLVDYDETKKWNDQIADNDDQKIDGIVTEIEFWHSGKFNEITDALTYARGLNITGRTGKSFYYATYLGGVTDAQTLELVPLIDYFWPHAYSKKVSSYYPMTQTRIQGLVKAQGSNVNTTSVMVTPIFSAESTQYSAYPSSVFGGDDLKARGNFSSMENEYKDDWQAATVSSPATTPPIALLTGYQWYEYVFFYLIMSDITPRPVFTPAPPSPAPITPVPTPAPPTPAPTPQPPTPMPPAQPLPCTTSADCLCPGTYCKSNGFCGGPACHLTTPAPPAATPQPPWVATPAPATPAPATPAPPTPAPATPVATPAPAQVPSAAVSSTSSGSGETSGSGTSSPTTGTPATTITTTTDAPITTNTAGPGVTTTTTTAASPGSSSDSTASRGSRANQNAAAAAACSCCGENDEFPWWIFALIFGLLCLVLIGVIIKMKLGARQNSAAQYHDANKHTLQFEGQGGESLQVFMNNREPDANGNKTTELPDLDEI